MLPIWLLEGLGENGDTVMAADFGDDPGIHPLTITRNGDTLTISGDNGNLTPQSGSKSFSLNDCIVHDGHTAEERGSAQAQSGFVFVSTTATTCYGPNSHYVLQGQVPADQVCQEQGVTAVGP
jgi:hypothetical protein